jgi:hypothetical protein
MVSVSSAAAMVVVVTTKTVMARGPSPRLERRSWRIGEVEQGMAEPWAWQIRQWRCMHDARARWTWQWRHNAAAACAGKREWERDGRDREWEWERARMHDAPFCPLRPDQPGQRRCTATMRHAWPSHGWPLLLLIQNIKGWFRLSKTHLLNPQISQTMQCLQKPQ